MNRSSKRKANEKISKNENEKRRRDQFTELINQLDEIVSNKQQQQQLSKSGILRQTVEFLQANLCSNINNHLIEYSWKPSQEILSIEEWFQIAIESMHCFFLVLSMDKMIVYVSKNIDEYLGYSSEELINQSIFNYLHPDKHLKFNEYFQMNHQILQICDLIWKRKCLSMNIYEQCSLIGTFRRISHFNEIYFVSIVQINTIERNLILNSNEKQQQQQFVTHLNHHGKFVYIDSNGRDALGYQTSEFVGHSFFHFIHPDDLNIVKRAHLLWKSNGQGLSEPYRFLTKGQQWILLQTNAQTHINSWNGKILFYICTSNIIQCSTNFSYPMMNYSFPNEETSEISSFLSEINNELSRNRMKEKLINLRQMKSNEIQLRQDEIRILDDIIQYLHQYKPKQDTQNDFLSNTHFENDFNPLTSIFSPSMIFSSPITPFSNSSLTNEQLHEINYLPTTDNNNPL